MPQDVIIPGMDWVWGHHQDGQDLTGLYGPITYEFPDGSTLVQPAPDIVQTPRGFIYAYDEAGRFMDPRRFAGEGGTPLDPGLAATASARATYQARPRPASGVPLEAPAPAEAAPPAAADEPSP